MSKSYYIATKLKHLQDYTPEDILRIATVLGFVGLLAFRSSFSNLGNSKIRRRRKLRFRPLEPQYLEPLREHFLYYQNLSKENKKRFETRVQVFIDNNEFIPRSYTHVSDEMKALISASAVQLTFGFGHLNFEHFPRILIYQDDYYSKITRKYHAGEVNPHGLIVLSWRNFVNGYKKHDDGKNLGLHEMAHALHLENAIANSEYDFIDPDHLQKFEKMAREEMALIRRGQNFFFRHYASMNKHEFFAVSIENFFERPGKFQKEKPELYQTMCALLRQDPLILFPGLKSPKNDRPT